MSNPTSLPTLIAPWPPTGAQGARNGARRTTGSRRNCAAVSAAITDSGFCREVKTALNGRARQLVDMGLATAQDGNIHIPVSTVATLERREVERVGQQMARDRGLTYTHRQNSSPCEAAFDAAQCPGGADVQSLINSDLDP